MEKTATYTVMNPPQQLKKRWLTWVAVAVSVVALVVTSLTAAVLKEQASRVSRMEGRMMEMESHFEDMLRLTIANHEYDYADYDYDDAYDDDDDDQGGVELKSGQSEGITVRRVVRRRRQTNSVENEVAHTPSIPIYDRPYGINLKHAATKSLLYDGQWDTEDEEDESQSANESNSEVTESPIKPHHRTESVVRRIDSANGNADLLPDSLQLPGDPAGPFRSSKLTQRKSRTKSLHGSRPGTKRQQRVKANNKASNSVLFRTSYVKSTSRHSSPKRLNSVVPPVPDNLETPRVVQQDGGTTPLAYTRPPTASSYGKKRRKPRNKQHRRRRRARPIITLAHFGATFRNTTNRLDQHTGEHLEWTPATWMDKLGLNAKYSLDGGTVTVKQSGLYYLYAQVLYESGRSGAGFHILVDDIPILECQLPALRPAPTCHTGGLSYLPRNAKVRVKDLDTNLVTVKRHQNTFFGMVKLMDALHTAEEMLLA